MSETADDTDSRAVPDGGDGDTDFGYFQTLEEAFIRLRGAPLLLSPADWQMAKEWRQRGIPVELIERVLGEVLEERREGEAAEIPVGYWVGVVVWWCGGGLGCWDVGMLV